MGAFDFVREAGAKVGIGDSKDEKQARAAPASAERAAEMAKRIRDRKAAAKAERMEKFDETKKAWGLEKYVKDLDIEIEDLDVRYDDGTATVTGTARSQEDREKAILAVGNVEGVGTVRDDIKVSEEAEESNMHLVVSGDTLSKIAKEYYGDAMKHPVIFEANRPMLKDPDKVYVGQVLRIPELS